MSQLDMVAYSYNPSTQKADTIGYGAQGQPWLLSEAISEKQSVSN